MKKICVKLWVGVFKVLNLAIIGVGVCSIRTLLKYYEELWQIEDEALKDL